MDTSILTLIVKAPNQLIEDQIIKCEPTWSVKRLKEHLSQVYPNKPPHSEQKLIYSGQLLNDTIVLQDVLREYGGPKRIHSLHLVCSPKYTNKSKTPENTFIANVEEVSSSNILNNTPLDNIPLERIPNLNWNNSHYNMHQFMMLQQSYVQYMQHYMNVAHLQRFGSPMPGLTDHAFYEYDNNSFIRQPGALWHRNNVAGNDVDLDHLNMGAAGLVLPQNNGGNVAANLQEPQQIGARNPEGAAVVDPEIPPAQAQQLRGIGLNEGRDHRDWLDHFYMVCRIMIFISIVYFYSSATRFIVVFFTAICLYLYHIGFFRNVNVNNNDINANERRPGEVAIVAAVGHGRVPTTAGANDNENDFTAQERDPSRLMVAWTFITTFLASLLPEIPNVV